MSQGKEILHMRKYYCDRCGTEIGSEYDVFTVLLMDVATQHRQLISTDAEICGRCLKDIANYIKKQPDPKKDSTVPEKNNKPIPKKRKNIDMGKVKALRDAGWQASDIAGEMGLSESETLDALMELWRKG